MESTALDERMMIVDSKLPFVGPASEEDMKATPKGRNRRPSIKTPIRGFEINDIVWAKMKGYRPWPALVQEVPEPPKSPATGRKSISNALYKVQYFGTKDISTVGLKFMQPFEEYLDINSKIKGRGYPEFKEAMRDVLSYRANGGIMEEANVGDSPVSNLNPVVLKPEPKAVEVEILNEPEEEQERILERKEQEFTPKIESSTRRRKSIGKIKLEKPTTGRSRSVRIKEEVSFKQEEEMNSALGTQMLPTKISNEVLGSMKIKQEPSSRRSSVKKEATKASGTIKKEPSGLGKRSHSGKKSDIEGSEKKTVRILPPVKDFKRVMKSENNDFDLSSRALAIPGPSKVVTRTSLARPLPLMNIDVYGKIVRTTRNTWNSSGRIYGFIGIDLLGKQLILRLLKNGFKVAIWDEDPKQRDSVEELYPTLAIVADSPGSVAQLSDIVFCRLPNREVMLHFAYTDNGFLQASNRKDFVQLSGVDLDTNATICDEITKKGGRYLELQIQGTIQQAEKGELMIMGANDESLLKESYEVLRLWSKKTFFLGSLGSAVQVNLMLQNVKATVTASIGETIALAKSRGQDGVFIEMLRLTDWCPQQLVAKTAMMKSLLEGEAHKLSDNSKGRITPFSIQQSVNTTAKDVHNFTLLDEDGVVHMPITQLTKQMYVKTENLGYSIVDDAAVVMAFHTELVGQIS